MEKIDAGAIGLFLQNKIKHYQFAPQVYEYGTVHSVTDDIVHVAGLSHCRYGELLEFENNVYGLAMDLHLEGVGAVLLNNGYQVSAGSVVKGTGHTADICVGPELLGRVVDPLGRPLDGRDLHVTQYRPVESPAPSIIHRTPVNTPMETGLLSVDSMIPIGRGQRELIIGDRQTGKTTMALSAMLNQQGKDVICIYCAIGQKASTVSGLVHTLEQAGAMDHTIVVSATAGDCSAMQYLAPYAGCAIAEHFMYQGKDVLIVYDDLSKHAVAYRAISLLLRRPTGREAYPGDVFYLHSRLLERAAKLDDALGGGSMTALPIVETMAGDISAYIPTNIISITDGQIYLESELFHAGMRPAVNVGLSVSRVGRSAQHPAMRRVSGSLRLDVAQYRDMAIFAQFGADIDDTTAGLLHKGGQLMELLKQPQTELLSLADQVAILLAFSGGALEGIHLDDIPAFKGALLRHVHEEHFQLLQTINVSGELPDCDKDLLLTIIRRFAASYGGTADAEHQ